ncbi:sirohydrochlorin cobaltochelatase [Listeria seeligeri]|uniref:sirohydrochlorin cobaltochelatase n=1 Tax=Listeria seeligeri TaxID=1640 RepID=UPI00162A5C9F|nr:sirohydrochlorin cobaltochelatase [Listeria seeligeri]MBC1725352.1 sirohydrochlorin cobaltochelatase [Listeria seeligeri]MBC1735477.1 sirohydrochlorin cobaltochelatase [Listeria seeligeri]MBF2365930.1 sirohydrochlorin cobaltochelatase [Listeria seeligeri]MBF2539651.1 sirohydrochlorin cobaltochelatase [Listeria seeligeri]MBF2586296.1 sirohydrochlorin cobaltochelatase [Listeria seeligeri]
MKKAILVVSFGTSYPETRAKTIEACEKRVAKEFPDYTVFRAFTSNKIIKKLKTRDNMDVDTPSQALNKLKELGYNEVIIQSLHIISGGEFEKITAQVKKFQSAFDSIIISQPLLDSKEDYEKAIEAIRYQMPKLNENEALILMGHGSKHHAFSAYACLDHMLLNEPIYLCAVESYPGLDQVIQRLHKAGIKKAHLMPFMLVAGDHATNDMASDEEDSWKSTLEQAGIETECHLQGLGENPLIQTQFIDHIHTAIERVNPRG